MAVTTLSMCLEWHDHAQSSLLGGWLNEFVFPTFQDRVLPIDRSMASRCARLHIPTPTPITMPGSRRLHFEHGMTVVTRNVADFVRTGVRLLNPWESQHS